MNTGRVFLLIGFLLVVFGLGISIFGPFTLTTTMTKIEDEEIRKAIVIDSEQSAGYSDWAGGLDVKNNYQMVFYMWNLTNPDEVIKGLTPKYSCLGPYIYRRYRTSANVTFLDNGNQVKYSDFTNYVIEPDSGSDRDLITNINPVWAGAMMIAGGEQAAVVAGSNPFIKKGTEYLTGPFISLYTAYTFPSYFQEQMNSKIRILNATFHDNTASFNYFLGAWANSTSAPVNGGNWTGLMISAGKNPSGISMASARKLLDPNEEYSLLNSDPQAAWTWDQSSINTTYAAILMTSLGISSTQLKDIAEWRLLHFAPIFMHPSLKQRFGVSNISDLGWVQFHSGALLDGEMVRDVFPDFESIYPEIAFEFFPTIDPPENNTFPSWKHMKQVMNDTNGLNDMLVYQDFLFYMDTSPDPGDFSRWGLTPAQAQSMFGYAVMVGLGLTKYAIINNMGPTGGLIVTKSVREWVFDCNDYLLTILQPTAPPCSFLFNYTIDPPTTIWTGKRDITKINQYVKWRDMEEIPDVWQSNLTVSGYTELGQFKPSLAEGESLYVFDSNLIRTVRMDNIGKSSIKGISTLTYMMNYSYTFLPSEFFYQSIAGVANVSSVENGSPMFLGYWDLLHVDPKRTNVTGLNTSATDFDSTSVLDVEPTTGMTIQARQRLQINVFIPPEAKSWFTFSPFGNDKFVNRINTFYPIAKAGEYVTLSDDEAKDLRNKLALIPKYTNILFYVYVTVGPALLVAGIVLVVFGLKKRTASGYVNIN